MDLNDALETFLAESRGLLQEMEQTLMQLEARPDDAEAMNALFRAAHTIKGSAGLFGLDEIVGFTHHLETLLATVREGSLALDENLAGLVLRCGDQIGHMLDDLEAGQPTPPEHCGPARLLVEQLLAAQGRGGARAVIEIRDASAAAQACGTAATCERACGSDIWHLSLRFSPELFQEGFDPASFIHHLSSIGCVVRVDTVTSALPPLSELDPECCHLGFEVRLATQAGKAEIEAVFEFIQNDCTLHLLPPDSRIDDYLRLIAAQPADKLRLGEILVAAGAITEHELAKALAEQAATPEPHAPLGQILVDDQAAPPEVVQAAVGRQAEVKQRQAQEAKLIRVHADKLDELINLVGELVIASASVATRAKSLRDRTLRETVSMMARLTEGVRDNAMRLRMVEIGETFNRYRRVVRDVSKELGKDIALQITGADTELDKSLVDRLGDPLMHLVRNAMDHGIEPAATRQAQGKPATGQLRLCAYHDAGSVVIEVDDDGAGLNRERILAKARQQGLVAEDAALVDAEVWQLVFEPGFSTADQVSKLSGRGVGMDVVRQAIEALRGTVEIDNRPGQGATFRIRLPLTLAIIDGFLMSVGEGHFVVPLDAVLECVKLDADVPERDVISLRGELLPLLRLRQHFGIEGRAGRRQNVVVVQVAGRRAGLVVDQLRGELQAVIKPLGPLMQGLPGISGSTILGSGEVALMLEIPALLAQAARQDVPEASQPRTPTLMTEKPTC